VKSRTKCTDLFGQDDKRRVVITVGEIKAAFNTEFGRRYNELFETAKRDVTAQLLAAFLTELNKEFGFGRKRLGRVKRGTESLFLLMASGGFMGKKFDTQTCIDYLRDNYGIDLDGKEAKQ